MTSPTMDAALRYAALGIAVFPLRPRTKQPYGRTTGLKMASADVELTRERWAGRAVLPLKPDGDNARAVTAGPSANVAIATGAPAGFWVLDLDGPEAAVWLDAREAEHGALPDTVEQQTARGRHLCFAWDGAAQAAGIRNRSMLDGAPVDVRGQEGYIVAPPSVHPGDEKKGVPPGWVYRWRDGHAPGERPFAAAPSWLIELVKPAPEPVAVRPASRVREGGRASAYGEAALDRAVGTIVAAQVGSRDSTLYRSACSIGRLVAGGEIDEAYARDALEGAGRMHVPSAMKEAQLVRQVERALAFGARNPKSAEDRGRRTDGQDGGGHRPAITTPPIETTGQASDARGLWAEAQCANVGLVRTWLKLRRLSHAGRWAQVAYAGLRAHSAVPVNSRGDRLPALLAPLSRRRLDPDFNDQPDALAVLPLVGGRGDMGAERFCHFIGDPTGKAFWLAACPDSRDDERQLLVALDLQDAWALGEAAFESDDPMGVVVTPTLSAFCGAPLGDAWGRVTPEMPRGDPDKPPWTEPGMAAVYLAVRGDLHPPEMRVRKAQGGTRTVVLERDAAARFCGSLAEQAWRRTRAEGGPEANAVRLLRPSHGDGFHSMTGHVA